MIRPPLPPHANPDAALLTCCEEAEERVLELTERLVNMDSGTDDLPGLERKAHVPCRHLPQPGRELRGTARSAGTAPGAPTM